MAEKAAEEKLYQIEELGSPLFTSRSSEVFYWEDYDREEEVLLKLFRPGVDQKMIDQEEINTKETYAKGVSAVACYGQVRVVSLNGTVRSGILLKKIPGQTLIARVLKHPETLFAAPKIMAEQQMALHRTHTKVIRSYKEMVRDCLNKPVMDFLTESERTEILRRLDALPDGDSILHLDYHPDNIMSDGEHISVIDYMTAASGAPAADVAATLYLLNEGEMIPGLNPAVAAVMEFLRKTICKKYLKRYKAASGMTDEEIAPWRLPFLIVRLGVWCIESETDDLQRKIREELAQQA
ncbi:MAG: phosphotransferase [Firmicutes bacterium]|nr:phosphotransferase [Bacillota bacterium]MDD7602541.1 phosphotransferase [Bacillota bacterium]MDY5856803.1 phosphotransferase [Anaerovoracaceae bacterium]